MSNNRVGQLVRGTYKVQVGAKTSLTRHGLTKRTEVWVMNTLDFFLLAPQPGVTFHPTLTNLLCTSSEGEDLNNALTSVSLVFEGVEASGGGSGNSLPPPVYTLSGVSYTFPLDTIEPAKWDAIKDYIVGLGTGGQEAYDAAFDENGRFVKFPKIGTGRYSGVETFDDGGLFWRVDFVTRTSQRGLLSKYQQIVTPKGNPPNVQGRTWRLVDFQERDLLNIYDVSLGYAQSGPNGDDPIIYGNTPASTP